MTLFEGSYEATALFAIPDVYSICAAATSGGSGGRG